MDVEYTGRQTTVTPKLKLQTQASVAQLEKIEGLFGSVHVILTEDKYRQIAEVTLTTKKHTLVSTCEATEMGAALHDAFAKVEQQAIRKNQKRTTIKHHPKGALKVEETEPGPLPAGAE